MIPSDRKQSQKRKQRYRHQRHTILRNKLVRFARLFECSFSGCAGTSCRLPCSVLCKPPSCVDQFQRRQCATLESVLHHHHTTLLCPESQFSHQCQTLGNMPTSHWPFKAVKKSGVKPRPQQFESLKENHSVRQHRQPTVPIQTTGQDLRYKLQSPCTCRTLPQFACPDNTCFSPSAFRQKSNFRRPSHREYPPHTLTFGFGPITSEFVMSVAHMEDRFRRQCQNNMYCKAACFQEANSNLENLMNTRIKKSSYALDHSDYGACCVVVWWRSGWVLKLKHLSVCLVLAG